MKRQSHAGFLAYYRVSTDRQRASGLGLEAQQDAVRRYVGDQGPILASYTEIESGKSHKNRPRLQEAIAETKRRGARLVIAKLDRLARNVHFISGLMESNVDFVAADMPQANKFTIHIFAASAENERDMISQRTKDALAAAKREIETTGFRVSSRSKAAGTPRVITSLGNPRWQESIQKATAARTGGKPIPPEIVSIIRDLRSQKKTFRQISDQLNGLHLTTPSGAKWYPDTVRRALLPKPAASGFAYSFEAEATANAGPEQPPKLLKTA